ncbi:MAG: 2-amino-4-hydroxy-6-hydroxymethyldihydropteridine diphosphokinase [Planctomycetota bacterium]|jgi:dihydroneopterin aldolase/2-amino-4-hydroxy-6-hydroxymethyldihydropteridine diphosphokinase
MANNQFKVFLAVGSNIEPEKNILQALQHVKSFARITGISTFYRTPALGRPEQEPFLNGVWRLETFIPAAVLKFDYLRRIENELGRVRSQDKYAARTIDIDIILYGSSVIDQPGLRVPDPDIRTRSFIAIPLLELEPEIILPDTKERLSSLVQYEKMEKLEPADEFTMLLRRSLI